MFTSTKAILVVLSTAILHGCIMAAVTDVETYDAIATEHFSTTIEDAEEIGAFVADCRWPCYRIGSSAIGIRPASPGSNLIAFGPLLPVLPAPGPGRDYGDDNFFIAVIVHPGNVSLVTFRPKDFVLRRAGDDEVFAPHNIADCDGGELEQDIVQVYGDSLCIRIEYPVTHDGLEQFTLVPAIVEADGTRYIFSDLEWRPGTYRVLQ